MHTSIHEKAEDNLRFIRSAMESATAFTGVSGLGFVLAGISAVVASVVAASQDSDTAWLTVWMLEMIVAGALTIGLSARKANIQGGSLFSGSGRKLLLAFIPTMTAGGFVTAALFNAGLTALLPGLWLTLYGAAVITAGAHSVSALPVLGMCFMLLGGLAFLVQGQSELMLGIGMGGFHIVAGIIIWRKFGG